MRKGYEINKLEYKIIIYISFYNKRLIKKGG